MPCANNCKVGRCSRCPSPCKRCGCDCDGVSPEIALKRKGGRQPRYLSAKKPKRVAAEKTRLSIAAISIDANTEHVENVVEGCETIQGIWRFFDWIPSREKNLPSRNAHENVSLFDTNKKAMYFLVQLVLDTTRKIANTLYPANLECLLQKVGEKNVKILLHNLYD